MSRVEKISSGWKNGCRAIEAVKSRNNPAHNTRDFLCKYDILIDKVHFIIYFASMYREKISQPHILVPVSIILGVLVSPSLFYFLIYSNFIYSSPTSALPSWIEIVFSPTSVIFSFFTFFILSYSIQFMRKFSGLYRFRFLAIPGIAAVLLSVLVFVFFTVNGGDGTEGLILVPIYSVTFLTVLIGSFMVWFPKKKESTDVI